jgi:hypothetical protein
MPMDEITLFLAIVISGLSILLFIVSLFSYIRLQNIKLLLVSLAFFAFIVKGILLILEILNQGRLGMIIDLVVLILLYFAVAKK